MICMHRDLFWVKRAQKIRFFQMKKCADIIAQTDAKMLEIRKQIEAQGVLIKE